MPSPSTKKPNYLVIAVSLAVLAVGIAVVGRTLVLLPLLRELEVTYTPEHGTVTSSAVVEGRGGGRRARTTHHYVKIEAADAQGNAITVIGPTGRMPGTSVGEANAIALRYPAGAACVIARSSLLNDAFMRVDVGPQAGVYLPLVFGVGVPLVISAAAMFKWWRGEGSGGRRRVA